MQIAHNTQRKIHFSNGKTFYVDFTSKNNAKLHQSLAISNTSHAACPYFSPFLPPNLFYRSNAHFTTHSENKSKIREISGTNAKQLMFASSNQNGETVPNLKSNKKNRNSISLETHTEQTKSSKKYRIFESSTNQCNGIKRSYTNLKTIKTNSVLPGSSSKKDANIQEQTTNPSQNICFSRSNVTYTTQQIPPYVKKLSSIQIPEVQQKLIVSSQPISRHQTYISYDTRKVSASPKEKLNFINQVQSKHYIAFQKSQNSLIPSIEKQKSQRQLQQSSNCKNNEGESKQIQQISIQNQKKIRIRGTAQNFCEQSTIKITQRVERKNQSNNNSQVSNIEQDNSYSRYFDTDDDLLPMLNRISYKNVEISNKSYQKTEEVVSHNIFMDFQKAPNSPLLHKRQTREIVHFDCTLNRPEKEPKAHVEHHIPSNQIKVSNTISAIPLFLILTTLILLIVQILA